jgi:CBS-domain-containing membrane protein
VSIRLDQAEALTAADIMHRRVSTLPGSATVGELRAYFAGGASRRLALLADGERYAGAVVAASLPDDAPDDAPATAYLTDVATVAPGDPATAARDLGLTVPYQRVVVVDETGRLAGIVAVNRAREGFCGT